MRIIEPYFGRPWLLLLLLPAAALTVISYARVSRRGLRGVRWKLPLALRLAAAALLVFIAADFSVVTDGAPMYTVIAADVSESMAPLAAQTMADAEALRTRTGGAALLFADSAAPSVFSEDNAEALRSAHDLNGAGTDLAAALVRAEQMFPVNSRKRIILLTDGLETDGSARKQAAALAGRGTRIDAVACTPWEAQSEVEIAGLSMPREMALGQTVKAAVTVRANAPVTIHLSLLDDGEQVYANTLRIGAGAAEYSIQVTPTRAGTHLFQAQVESEEDGCGENNALSCCVNVEGSAKILLVDGTGQESRALSQLLTDLGYEVETVSPQSAPPNTASMCKYGLVILMNVDTQALRPTAPAALEEYVARFGGSVLLTGGENTFAYGNMHETALESVLPVTVLVEEQESAEPVALLLLIDNSASMGETGVTLHSDFGRPIEMAKLGAIKSISLLHDNDYAGVISFSNKAHLLSPLRPASEREEIIATVSRMGLISGTMYTEALTEALNQFSQFEGTEKKHIIFLSDGNPSDDDYMPVVRRLAEMGVTISAISVGATIDSKILEDIAKAAGGRFAAAASVSDLPNFMTSDTLLQQVEYTVTGAFTPDITPQAARFSWDALPKITGYVRVTPRADAEVLLLAEKNRPLYAQWHFGTGMAACFMSDLSGRWSEAWLREEVGKRAIADLIAALLPEEQAYAPLDLALSPGGREAMLILTAADAQAGESYEADVKGPLGDVESVRLVLAGPGRYERLIPLMGFGRYDVTLRQYDAVGSLIDTFETAVAASRSKEYEAFPAEEDRSLLSALCEATGGSVYPSVQAALDAPLEGLTADMDLSGPLALLAALLFLGEVILRRIPIRRRDDGPGR